MNQPTKLVVDLDGTLLKSDVLIESLFAFLKRYPFQVYQLFFWLLKGKAYLKAMLAESVDLNVSVLPYDNEVLSWIRGERESGRDLVLATATHHKYANHLGI